MHSRALTVLLQVNVVDSLLLTLLQAVTVAALLGVGVLTVHLLVRALRARHGRLRDRDARLVLAAAGVLFVVGFGRLVVADGAPSGSLAGVALGGAAAAYLLYLARPTLFAFGEPDEPAGDPDTEPTR
jgi:uncharacterized membrane protein